MNVLFISAWYPHRYDSMVGLFVQKHAEAVSLYADVKALYVHADKHIRDFEIVVNQYNSIEEYRIYYPYSEGTLFGKIKKIIYFFRAYKKGFDAIKKTGWMPDILHANVLTRTPFIAFLYKKRTGTPYVITEHWTRLLKERKEFNGFWRKLSAKIIVKNAGYILPVSIELQQGLEYHQLLKTKCRIVENVVDTCFYRLYPPAKTNKKQFLNVTCFYERHKNLFGLLRAVKRISLERNDFELILVGTGDDYEMTYNYYQSLDFEEETVIFAGLKTSQEVAVMMQSVNFIVQFSNYESAGVVVEEALVSGKPVISTKVGIAPDFIDDSNGLLVNVRDEEQLTNAIRYMLDNFQKYDSTKIRENASKLFSYEYIGKKFIDVYNDTIKERIN